MDNTETSNTRHVKYCRTRVNIPKIGIETRNVNKNSSNAHVKIFELYSPPSKKNKIEHIVKCKASGCEHKYTSLSMKNKIKISKDN